MICKIKILLSVTFVVVAFPALAKIVQPDFTTIEASVTTQTACHDLLLDVADTPALRQFGLMFREVIPEDTGMLLDYQRNQPVAIWMKNTPSPLDIIFIDSDGIIQNIHENAVPYALKTIPSQQPVQYALEVKAGYVQTHDLGTGDAFALQACPEPKA